MAEIILVITVFGVAWFGGLAVGILLVDLLWPHG